MMISGPSICIVSPVSTPSVSSLFTSVPTPAIVANRVAPTERSYKRRRSNNHHSASWGKSSLVHSSAVPPVSSEPISLVSSDDESPEPPAPVSLTPLFWRVGSLHFASPSDDTPPSPLVTGGAAGWSSPDTLMAPVPLSVHFSATDLRLSLPAPHFRSPTRGGRASSTSSELGTRPNTRRGGMAASSSTPVLKNAAGREEFFVRTPTPSPAPLDESQSFTGSQSTHPESETASSSASKSMPILIRSESLLSPPLDRRSSSLSSLSSSSASDNNDNHLVKTLGPDVILLKVDYSSLH